MLIFLAGAHGVGKTFLGKPIAERLGIRYATASALIREEMGSSNWDAAKRVKDIAANQEALISAVARVSTGGAHLMLDGHFVLRDADGYLDRLPVTVFARLGISAALLLEAPAEVVAQRLTARGSSQPLHLIEELAIAERQHGELVCRELSVPLWKMASPSEDEVSDLLASHFRS